MAIGFVSSVAIPISLVLAFFGINASQVDADQSMFDSGYAGVYAGVGMLAVIAAGLALALYLVQLRWQREGSTGSAGSAQPEPGTATPAPRPPSEPVRDSPARKVRES